MKPNAHGEVNVSMHKRLEYRDRFFVGTRFNLYAFTVVTFENCVLVGDCSFNRFGVMTSAIFSNCFIGPMTNHGRAINIAAFESGRGVYKLIIPESGDSRSFLRRYGD